MRFMVTLHLMPVASQNADWEGIIRFALRQIPGVSDAELEAIPGVDRAEVEPEPDKGIGEQ